MTVAEEIEQLETALASAMKSKSVTAGGQTIVRQDIDKLQHRLDILRRQENRAARGAIVTRTGGAE